MAAKLSVLSVLLGVSGHKNPPMFSISIPYLLQIAVGTDFEVEPPFLVCGIGLEVLEPQDVGTVESIQLFHNQGFWSYLCLWVPLCRCGPIALFDSDFLEL